MNKKLLCLLILCLLAVSAFARMERPHRRHHEHHSHHPHGPHDPAHPHPHPRPPHPQGSESDEPFPHPYPHPHPQGSESDEPFPHPHPHPHPHPQGSESDEPFPHPHPHPHPRPPFTEESDEPLPTPPEDPEGSHPPKRQIGRHHLYREDDKNGFSHPKLDEIRKAHKRMNKVKTPRNGVLSKTTLIPGVNYEKTIDFLNVFSIPFTKGDSIAVQIVRASSSQKCEKNPHLYLCRQLTKKCDDDEKNKTLSFQVSSDDLSRVMRKGSYDFSLSKTGRSDIVVGMYVCVGPDATLETCKSPCTKDCEQPNGHPSDVVDICVCDDGYTGSRCEVKAPAASGTSFDSQDFEAVADLIITVISLVCSIVFFTVFVAIVAVCCICLHACCCGRRRRSGRVVGRYNRPVPPPPAYPGGQYYPLDSVPPPPPPPPMPGQGVEMAVLPPVRASNPVYIMPPLAPVKQVPVFVQPPAAPKN